MKKVAIILGLALSAITSAQAQSRFVVEGNQSLVYRESLATYGDNNGLTALGWWKLVSKYENVTTRYLVQVHCSTRLFRFIRVMEHRENRLVYSDRENWSSEWENPVPGTIAERFQQMCDIR